MTKQGFYVTLGIAGLRVVLYFVAQPDPEQNTVRGRDWQEEVAEASDFRGWQARFLEVGLSRNGVFVRQTEFASTIEFERVKFAWWMKMAASWV